jgi:hypothetical protein
MEKRIESDAEGCSRKLLQDNAIYTERSEMIWTGAGVSLNKDMSDCTNHPWPV